MRITAEEKLRKVGASESYEMEIVGNSRRQILVMPDWTYVYIPMTAAEIEVTGSECITNPAWRITVVH